MIIEEYENEDNLREELKEWEEDIPDLKESVESLEHYRLEIIGLRNKFVYDNPYENEKFPFDRLLKEIDEKLKYAYRDLNSTIKNCSIMHQKLVIFDHIKTKSNYSI